MPETMDAVKVLIAFIMPGFVTDYIVSFAAPRHKREPLETTLTAVTFSSELVKFLVEINQRGPFPSALTFLSIQP